MKPKIPAIFPLFFLCAALALPAAGARAATYYLDARTGNDRNDGRTPRHAWRSLARANQTALSSGDELVLAEGQQFTGHLELPAKDAAARIRPVIIRGAGVHRPTIVSPDHTAIVVVGGQVEIRNLILQGNAPKYNKGHHGIELLATGRPGGRSRFVRVDHVEVRAFGDDGISIGIRDDSVSGYDDLQIRDSAVHGIYGTAIISYDKVPDRKLGYAHRNVTVYNCDVSRNHDGSGIILSGIEHGLVDRCLSSGNEGAGGGVGMWAYSTKDVRFRYCIASGTRTHGKDGGGFDLDGACINCVVEHCLAYDNDGPGYMHCDYPTAGLTTGNIIRESISINDGQYKEKDNSFGIGFVTWGSGLDDCHITGNLTMITADCPQAPRGGGLFVAYIPKYGGKGDVQHVHGCTLSKNVVVIARPGPAMVQSDLPKATPDDARYVDNDYRAVGDATPKFVWDDQHYDSLDAWRSATAEEPQATTAATGAPMPTVDRSTYALTDPAKLPAFPLLRWLIAEDQRKTGAAK